MEGFFTKRETESISRPDGKIRSCASCGLYRDCETPRMKPAGSFAKSILIIGDAPGKREDQEGLPFQDASSRTLQRTLEKLGIDLWEDCLMMYACHCMPIDENHNPRNPTTLEVDNCRKTTLRIIDEHMPKVVILLGNSAVYSVIGHRWKKDLGDIHKWRGWTIPDQDLKTWLCPVYHPDMLDSKKREIQTIWEQDLQRAIEKVEVIFPKYIQPKIDIITDLSALDSIKAEAVAYDYETTGIKPHAKGHRIICASVADDEDHVFVFLLPKNKEERLPFIRLLENPFIGKMAHNMKYEDTWTKVRLRTTVNNWAWDSMLAAHILDNRPNITGLKFQVYVQFGVVDYDSEVSTWLQSGDKNGNALNHIEDLLKTSNGKEQLLTYCALDSINEFRLAKLQQKQMDYSFLPF